MTTATPTATDRLHALDAARALALLLGIALHASMSFFLPIPVQDPSASTTLAVGFFLIHSFRMTLFFLIAGYFGHLLWQRLGTRSFLRDRSRRIGLPLLGGWLLLAPISIAIVVWGLTRSGVPSELAQSSPADQGLPLVHLWFLYYLGLFYLATAALRALWNRLDPSDRFAAAIDRALAWTLRRGLAPVLLALPAAAVLALDPGWRVWFGIHTPDFGLRPQLPASIAYGSAFAAGWWLRRQGSFLTGLASRWRSHLLLAVGLSIFALLLVGPRPNLFDATTLAGGEGRRVLYAAVYALSGWYWSFGLLGACQRWLARPSARWRYLADASYWIYLLHLPLVFGLQVALRDWPLHWSLKFPLIVGLTLVALLLSYRWFVRGSWIGALLNGRRKAPGLAAEAAAVATPVTPITAVVPDEQSPLAELRGVRKGYGQTVALDGLDLQVRPGELLAVLGPNGAGK
ncbi:MAG: acyltransferase family protein, partial [Xanthomonadales bacterium]|nr:acyltransferase family protein [Xanthomonadales bacterium]